MDTDARWTPKRGRRPAEGRLSRRPRSEFVISVFGYKNHLGIDRRHGFIRSFKVTDAAAHDGRQLGRLLDPDNTASPVWADTAYRSAANFVLLARRGLAPPVPAPQAARSADASTHRPRQHPSGEVRVAIEHVFAAQKCRLGLIIRTVGLARATNLRRDWRFKLARQS